MRPHKALCALASLALAGATYTAQPSIIGERASGEKPFRATALASFDHPWALAFLPSGEMLVTEKGGRMLLLSADAKRRAEVRGVPAVDSSGQGALGEVVPHPDFGSNRLIYFSYSEPGTPNAIVLARGRLDDDAAAPRLDGVKILYRAYPRITGGQYAGRIAFSANGYLFFSLGERQKFTPAQARDGVLGKIVRLTMDGEPAADGPLTREGFPREMWSYGHRNPLGLGLDAGGRLWETEMGPRGGDELNLILPGRNYGWPLVSNGDNYDGRPIPDHPSRPDLEAPKLSWNPSISPSSLLIYSGSMFPKWRGKAMIGALSGKMLILVSLGADEAHEEARYDMGKRIRAVDQGVDGAVYLLEDGPDGRLLKLTPLG